MERSKDDDKSIMIVGGGGGGEEGCLAWDSCSFWWGKGSCSHILWLHFFSKGRTVCVWECIAGAGEGCDCRGLLCSQSFLRYWRSRCPCAPFHICRSKQFFLSLCWDLISRNKTENTGEKRGISARAFLAFVSSSALIVFRSQYLIFPTSGSQFFLMRQRLSGIILV